MSDREFTDDQRRNDTIVATERADKHGSYYWYVRLVSGEYVYFMADEVTVNADGALLVHCHLNKEPEKKRIYSAFSAGTWQEVHAASCIDGSPMTICDDDRLWAGTKYDYRNVAKKNSTSAQAERAKSAAAVRAAVTPKLRHRVISRDGFKCKACGRGGESGVTLHVDHIIAVAKGGDSSESNLQTLCSDCNFGKGAQ